MLQELRGLRDLVADTLCRVDPGPIGNERYQDTGRRRALDVAKQELTAARRVMSRRLRGNMLTPADLDRVANAHQQYLRLRLGL